MTARVQIFFLALLCLTPRLSLSEELTESMFRGATRYTEHLLTESPEGTLFLFPGRSLTLLSLIAEGKGAQVVNIPGSGLTELYRPDAWTNPATAPQLDLYRSLIKEQLIKATKGGRPPSIVIADSAQTGNSLFFFEDLVRELQREIPSLRNVPITSRFLPTGPMNPEVLKSLKAKGVSELKLALPHDTSGMQLTPEQLQTYIDRFYYHEYETEKLSADASNVPQFNPLDVNVRNLESVREYKRKFLQRDTPENVQLKSQLTKMAREVPVSETSLPFKKMDDPCWAIESVRKRAA